MSALKTKELRELTDQEILDHLTEERSTLQDKRFMHAVSGLENPLILRISRRNVAKLETELNRRKASGANAAE